MRDEIRANLWTDAVDAQSYQDSGDKYQTAILEQYKLYVEMADRISNRRTIANAFFLTLNSAAFAVIGFFWQDQPSLPRIWAILPLAVLLTQCLAWFVVVRSYRQLNSGKWAVVGVLEERLPASPYWRAEWMVLGAGQDRSRYWPTSHIEQVVPVLFAIVYTGGFLMIQLS
jgi:hypothetical protein